MFNYVIKIENNSPVGYPITLENFKEVFSLNKVTASIVKHHGFAPFIVVEKPNNTLYTKVVDNGMVYNNGIAYTEYLQVEKEEEELDLVNFKEEQKIFIKEEFETHLEGNHVSFNEVEYHAGIESTIRLTTVINSAEIIGDTEITFFDVNNIGQTLTIDDAKTLLTAMHNDFQTQLAKKQSLLNDIENANTVSEVLSLTW